MKKLMFLILVGITLISCVKRQNNPTPNNEYETPNELIAVEPTNSIKVIEQSDFINHIGRVFVVEIQGHHYIIMNGSDRGHPIHAESCPKKH